MFKKRNDWWKIRIVVFVMLIIMSLIYADFRLQASVLEIAKAKVQVSGAENINRIIKKEIVNNVDYKDIIYIHKDETGRIVLLQPDTVKLNQIMTETVIQITEQLGGLEEQVISIPLGELTGSKLLAGYGPKAHARIMPVGQVQVAIENKFEQAGINQTRHLIYFKIDNTVKIAVPFIRDEIMVSATVPLAETIIVGEVPQTYVNFSGNAETLYPLIKDK